MSIKREVSYTEPVRGKDRSAIVTIDVEQVDFGGTVKTCLVARAAGRNPAAYDVTDQVRDAIDGEFSGQHGAKVGTYLSAKWTSGTKLYVDDDAGFVDGTPVAVFNSEGDTPEYRLISGSPAGDSFNLHAALTGGPYYKGAFVVSLSGREFASGRGHNRRQGVRAQLEAPTSVSISVADSIGNSLDVTVTPNDEDKATHYDVYIRDADFERVEPNWRPDLEDQTSVASALHVTTYGGGADCVPDGGGGNLGSGSTYYVAVVAKGGAGQHDVDESEISNIVSHTLD